MFAGPLTEGNYFKGKGLAKGPGEDKFNNPSLKYANKHAEWKDDNGYRGQGASGRGTCGVGNCDKLKANNGQGNGNGATNANTDNNGINSSGRRLMQTDTSYTVSTGLQLGQDSPNRIQMMWDDMYLASEKVPAGVPGYYSWCYGPSVSKAPGMVDGNFTSVSNTGLLS